jgi:hypothetical protein
MHRAELELIKSKPHGELVSDLIAEAEIVIFMREHLPAAFASVMRCYEKRNVLFQCPPQPPSSVG